MPVMVHLTSAKYVQRISRTGIHKGKRGVYCMPVLQDYYSSHQWLRELRRSKPGPLVAVYFRLNDDEQVECGLYWQTHYSLSVVEAVRLFRQQSDIQGWEILVPRSIKPGELHKVQALSQVLGWRYSPGSHKQSWCNCPVCVSRGEFNASKKRETRVSFSYKEVIATLRRLNDQVGECQDHKENEDEIIRSLDELYYRKAGQASDLLFLLDYPSNDVLEALAELLEVYKGRQAKRMLREVNRRRSVEGA